MILGIFHLRFPFIGMIKITFKINQIIDYMPKIYFRKSLGELLNGPEEIPLRVNLNNTYIQILENIFLFGFPPPPTCSTAMEEKIRFVFHSFSKLLFSHI